ncbi:thioredoxin family protein [Bacillus sp. CGMCC 1.16541]|uniref:thioredoxin family protein n=1 Tax=Bacillus sp. CGMCC 1.16541 TaxID=2185143 RepID=UPI000D73B10A|nr:thioredoxin family protein [Bacillus sp. CGMCC 1.16541]
MKKIILFASIILVIFGALVLVTNMQNKEKAEGNPYGKDTIHPETAKQLDDPNYQNLILPDELDEVIENKETVTVYFYSPLCEHCKKATPVVAPLAEDMGVDLQKFNLLEFDSMWDKYGIESTPTIIHYVDGQEVDRLVGNQPEETFKAFLEKAKASK